MNRPPQWRIIISRQPKKALRKLPVDIRARLDEAILSLAKDPRPAGCRQLTGYEKLYRVRVGDWRIVYAIEDDELIILVVAIAHRSDVYRDLQTHT